MSTSKYDGLLAEFYDLDHGWRDYEKQVSLLTSIYPDARERKNIKVLDLCCGTGSHSVRLARNGFQVSGIDLSPVFLKKAEQKAKAFKQSVNFRKMDAFTLYERKEFFSTFDCVILLGWTLDIVPVFEKFDELLKGIAKALKPSGLFVFDVALGRESHKVSTSPLNYTVSPALKGQLTIREKVDVNGRVRRLSYQWDISQKNGVWKKFSLSARENLMVLQPCDIFSLIEKHNGLEVFKKLSDYNLKAFYRQGKRNLVVILRKKDGF